MLKGTNNKIRNGRKYNFGLVCLLVLFGGFALTGLNPVMASAFSEFITGVLGVYFVLAGGNVASKFSSRNKTTIATAISNFMKEEEDPKDLDKDSKSNKRIGES